MSLGRKVDPFHPCSAGGVVELELELELELGSAMAEEQDGEAGRCVSDAKLDVGWISVNVN